MKTLVVTQTVAYYGRDASLAEILAEVEEGDYETKNNEVRNERVQVFDDEGGRLLYDSDPERVVTVFLSQEGSEATDVQELADTFFIEDPEPPHLDWIGTDERGEEVTVRLRVSTVDPNEEE